MRSYERADFLARLVKNRAGFRETNYFLRKKIPPSSSPVCTKESVSA
jgi:hypothetical protein